MLLNTPFDVGSVPPSFEDNNLALALELASRGVPVFPCQFEGEHIKKPQRGVMWRSQSTTDHHRILQWWDQWPGSLPGINMAKLKTIAIDCDRKPNRPDGVKAFAALSAIDHGEPIVATAGGGEHHFFKNWNGHGNGRGNLPDGIDVRGAGGFVIAPGSMMPDGRMYLPVRGDFLNPPDAPDWLKDLLEPRHPSVAITLPAIPASASRLEAYGNAALQELLSELSAAQPGIRNDTANIIAFRAGQLVGGGCLTHSEAYSALSQAVLSWGVRPNDKALGPRGTIERALKAGAGHPRGPDDGPSVDINIQIRKPEDIKESFDPETGELPDAGACDEIPYHLLDPPGLVGQITDWITDTALFPQRGLALGAALTIVGTAAGRHLAGPYKCGTHLYVVGLAPSGAGKNHPLSQIAVILDAAGMREHIGPSQFISMPAVIRFLCRTPLAVCAMDEFGSFLKRINNRRASGFEGAISGMLRTAWGSSFGAMATPEWASQRSETIFSPAMSIFGISTAKEFYDGLEGGDVTNGVLNRFLLIETKKRPQERPPLADSNKVPGRIIDDLKALYHCHPMAQLCQSKVFPAYETLAIASEAETIRRGLVRDLHAKGDADRDLEPFLARTAENALRLATIVTVGLGQRTIEPAAMQWACDFAVWSSNRLANGAGLYIADSDTQAAANAVRRAIQDKGGRIRRRDLLRALAHRYKRRELEDVISSLAEAEMIMVEKVESGAQGGRPVFWYTFQV